MNSTKPQIPFCQSCSMPLEKSIDFGTNADGTLNTEYCHYCYRDGNFIEPNATMQQVITKSVQAMKQRNMPETLIAQTKQIIPTLKRWNTK